MIWCAVHGERKLFAYKNVGTHATQNEMQLAGKRAITSKQTAGPPPACPQMNVSYKPQPPTEISWIRHTEKIQRQGQTLEHIVAESNNHHIVSGCPLEQRPPAPYITALA